MNRTEESLLWCLIVTHTDEANRDPRDEMVAQLWLETYCYLAAQEYDEIRRPPNYDQMLASIDDSADLRGTPN